MNLATAPIDKKFEQQALLGLALPIVLSQVSQMFFGLTDTFIVSLLGTVELAASSFANNLFFFFTLFGLTACNAISPIVAQYIGKSDISSLASINSVRVVAYRLGIVLSFILMGCMWAMWEFRHLLHQPPEVLEKAQGFYLTLILTTPSFVLFQVLRQYSEALNQAKLPLYVTFAGLVLNGLLNFWFVFGGLGLPALGITGSGIATLLTRTLMVFFLYGLMKKQANLRRYLEKGSYNLAISRELLALGVPSGFIAMFETGAFAMSAVLMGNLNKESLAAHQITLSFVATTFMVTLGISIATGIRVGEAVGQKNARLIRVRSLAGLKFSWLFMAATSFVIFVLHNQIGRLFSTDLRVLEIAASLLIVAGIFQIFDGTQVTCVGILRALSDIKIPFISTLVAYWGIGVPVGYWLGFSNGHGAWGIWVGLAVGLASAAFFLLARVYFVERSLKYSPEKELPKFV